MIIRQHVKFPSTATTQVVYVDPGRLNPDRAPENNFTWQQIRPWVPSNIPLGPGERAFWFPVWDLASASPSLPVGASQLIFSLRGANRLLLTDPLGRRRGRDSLGTVYSEIPGAIEEPLDYNDPDPLDTWEFGPGFPSTQIDETLMAGHLIPNPAPGTYQIRVWGDPAATVTAEAYGPSTSASRTYTGGDAAGRTYSYWLPAGFGTAALTPGDRVTLSQRLLIPMPPDGARIFVADPGLGAGLYSDPPSDPANYLLDPRRGALGMLTGELTDSGGDQVIRALQLFSALPPKGNQPPVALWDSATVASGAALVLPEAFVLANDTDPEMDVLSVTAVGATPDTRGSLSLAGGEIHYTPDPGVSGFTNFVYEIRDPSGNYGAAAVSVRVIAATGLDNELGLGRQAFLQSWPVPARTHLFVRFRLQESGVGTLTLTDVAGRTVSRRTVSGAETQVAQFSEIAKLPSGVYLLTLRQGDLTITERVVIVR